MLSLWRLDYRSLACLRICLGLILLFDLTTYFGIVDLYLTDAGMVSRATFLAQQANPWNWSLLHTSGAPYFVYGFLLWHAVTLLLFVFGYKTRLNTFFLWIQIVSIHNRNWTVINGGDDLIRCCLILLIFLPLGHAFSIDNRKNKFNLAEPTYNSFFCVALFIQLTIMYLSSALFKDHPIWNEEYSALYYALNLDLFVRPLGTWVKSQDYLIAPMTAAAYYFELYGPALILLGLFKKFWNHSRYILVISFVSFHLMIDLLLNVGTFPYFAIALWLAFLPTHFWDNFKVHTQLKIFYAKMVFRYKYFLTVIAEYKNNFQFSKKIILNLLGVFFILNLLFWPLRDKNFTLQVGQKYYPDFFTSTNRWLATYQSWYLFAPYPKVDNLWMELNGKLENGKTVDLFRMNYRENPLTAQEVQAYYTFEKWRKILLKIEHSTNDRTWLAEYYCRNWNKLSQDNFEFKALESVEFVAHNQITQRRGIASRQRTKNVLTTYTCPSSKN